MQRLGKTWIRSGVWLTLMLLVTGCMNVASDKAICDGTKIARADHAAALAADGGALSVLTGANLISQIDAACAMMRPSTS